MLRGLLTGQHFKKQLPWESKMEVKNMLIPNQTQMDEFLEEVTDAPISMVNLLKFKDKAEYEDGRKTDLTGKDAYSIYAIEVVDH